MALLYYAKNFVDAIRETYITATSLSLFKDNSCIAVTPWFLDALSKTSTSCQELSSFLMIIILSMILKAMFFTLTLNFDAFRSTLTSMLTTFTYLQSTTLTNGPEHLNILSNRQYFTMDGCIQKKLTPKMKEPPFLPDQILIGNLPQTDLFFSHFCSAFPMLTSPTHQKQQANTIPPRPQSVLAVNLFAMCKPFGLDTSVAYHDDKITTEIKHDGYSFHSKQLYQPDPTDSLNFSMDFLPPLEYLMFKVVQFVHKNNPLNRLYRHQSPMKVIVFQGTPLHCPYYSPASPTECSHHEEKVHTFPITYTKEGFQHNNHHLTNEAYDITTVQLLFKQPCISMRECFLENPEMAPIDSNDKRFHPYSATHHVAIDPRCAPFGLAFCMIEAFIISSWTLHVYEAWARSHAEDALQSIHQIPHLNDYSYFHRHRCEHPPYKYTTKHETPPVSNDGTGELLLDDLTLVDAIVTGNLSASSSRDSGLNLSERENDKFNTVNRYFQQTPTSFSGQHLFAFLAVQTQRPSLCPSNPAPDDPPIGIEQPHASETTSSSSVTTESDDQTHILLLPPTTAQLSSSQTTESYTEPAHNEPNEEEQQEEEQLTTQPLTLQQISLAVSQIVTPKPIPHSPPNPPQPAPPQLPQSSPLQPPAPPMNIKRSTTIPPGNNVSNQLSVEALREAPQHPTFAFPSRVQTRFCTKEDTNNSDQEPTNIQPPSSENAMASSTDFTYPQIEDLTKTLLKYAKNANLRTLTYPTDLVARRRHFNTFMDNLRIVCNISPWTCKVFDLWPEKITYSHPVVGTALYNLLFTNITEQCQKHIIDLPPDFRTAIMTLRRHCAPLTPDHIERTRESFYSLKQQNQEVATSYLNRIRILTRDCYHAGIPNSDTDLIKRTVRGGSNHHFYAASYQRFDADIRRAELNNEPLPTFDELESHLLNIDDTRSFTISSQQQRHHTTNKRTCHVITFRRTPHRNDQHIDISFRDSNKLCFSSILRPYSNNTNIQANCHRPNECTPQQPPNNSENNRSRQNSNFNERNAQHQRPQNRRPQSNTNQTSRPAPFRPNNNSVPSQRRPPRNQQRAYYITDSTNSNRTSNSHQQAFIASSLDTMDDTPQKTPWPDTSLPQMEVNQPLLDRDYPSSTQHQPPNTNAEETYPDDPKSPHQRFGPPDLRNWLPDSGATSHYTPVFSDLCNPQPCNIPVSLADGNTKTSTFKGTCESLFTSDNGQKAILGLTDVLLR